MKKTIKSVISLVLVIAMSFSLFTFFSSSLKSEAANSEIDLYISTNQSKYSWGDTIYFDITVTNISDNILNNVKVFGMPRYSKWFNAVDSDAITISQINAGESATVQIAFESEEMSTFKAFFAMMFKCFSIDSNYRKHDFNEKENVKIGTTKLEFGFETTITASLNFFTEPSDENVVQDDLTGETYVNNEVLISANEGVSYAEIEKVADEISGEIVGCIQEFGEYQIRFAKEYTKEQLSGIIEDLKTDARIYNAAFDYAMNISDEGYLVPNDPWGENQNWDSEMPEGNNWGVEAINSPQAWDHRDEMKPIKIGVIDSGFMTNHSDLTFSMTKNNTPSNHGTHVAGTIAADWDNDGISGVMPTDNSSGEQLVELYGISQNGGSFKEIFTFEMKSCYAELILRGVKVINISQGFNWYMGTDNGWDSSFWENNNIKQKARNLAIEYSKQQEEFLKRVLLKGYEFVLVCAAGNDGIDAEFGSPMNAIQEELVKDRIIVVGAIENRGVRKHLFIEDKHLGYKLASFTNIGDRVDLVAPGVDIYSTVASSTTAYDTMSGTSMAAPHVSGVAAMVWSINPYLTGEQVKEIVVNSADRPVNHNGSSYDILNAENAINEAIDSKTSINPWQPENNHLGTVISRVVDKETSDFIEGATIAAFNDMNEYVGSAMTDESGQFELIVPAGDYTIIASDEGFLPFVLNDVTVAETEVNYTEWFYLAKDNDEAEANIKGIIRDATNNSVVSGVNLKFENIYTHEIVGETTSSNTGAYSIRLPAGYYTVKTSKTNYIDAEFTVSASLSTSNLSQDYTISPILGGDEYRIVLTWGEKPSDLDSHITGTKSNGSSFHVFFGNKNAWDGDENVANLDVDDTSSYGPETITLVPTSSGTYRYYIHNYSGNSEGEIANSSAQIKLYKGNQLVATYNAPTNQGTGIYWTVFEITNGEIKTINRISDSVVQQ